MKKLFIPALTLAVFCPFVLDAMKRLPDEDKEKQGTKINRSEGHIDINSLVQLVAQNCSNPQELINAVLELLKHCNHNDASLIVRAGLEAAGVSLYTCIDNDGNTVLHWTAFNGQTEVIQALLAACTNNQEILDLIVKRNHAGATALYVATSNPNPSTIKLLVNTFIKLEPNITLYKVFSQVLIQQTH